ncbi:MAG TPA: hypothetical protein VKX28_30090 [Xanthobacteraceae bacterium]|nr:hypothetical protein [Xanthobacteraceae bacterium]
MTHRTAGAIGALLLASSATALLVGPFWLAAAFAQAQPTLTPDEQISPRQVQTVPAAQPKTKPKPKPEPRSVQAGDTPAGDDQAATPPPAAAPKPKPKPKPAAAANTVSCSGLFAKDSSHVKLAEFFPAGSVEYGQVEGQGGSALNATIVYPKDPKRRLEVLWQNDATRSDTSMVVITGGSQWKGPKGLHLGLAIAALEKINGKPFKLTGFDQPNGARAVDWMGGALASLPGGCQVGMKFDADRKATPDLLAAVAGKELISSNPAVRAVKPTVSEIVFGYQ